MRYGCVYLRSRHGGANIYTSYQKLILVLVVLMKKTNSIDLEQRYSLYLCLIVKGMRLETSLKYQNFHKYFPTIKQKYYGYLLPMSMLPVFFFLKSY
jgi:hypothetical protein